MASWIRGKLLGAGAFGSVNLAMKRENGEVFAVKSVPVHQAASEVAVRAIENEIEILQGLDSRYVVRCFGSDWTEESGIVMRNAFLEYMPEGCLIDFVKQFASLDEHLLRTYTRSIVEGIDYLHSQGIVHCDIKGKNILVGNGAVKLTDFGSSKRIGDEAMAAEIKLNGTPLWMAPEVVQQVEQGPASDIWSLGCTVVEMATGRAPWSNFTNHFVALYHIGCTDELPEVPASLSADAHDFLSHCFQRDPCKRWTSAQLLQHPFLTARAPKAAPASPISVMHFPADSDSDEASFVNNSVPTLAAPSLFKRGLVCAQHEQHEDNWWSSPESPDSKPWIVVRSPKSASSPSSFVTETPAGEDCVTAPFLNASESLEASASVESVSVLVDDDVSDPPHTQVSVAKDDTHVRCHFAISKILPDRVKLVSGNHARFFLREDLQCSDDSEVPSTSLNFCSVDTISEYSEHENVYSFSNPQILLYWLHRTTSRDFECLKSGHSNHCILFQDEYTIIPVPLQTKLPVSSCICVTMFLRLFHHLPLSKSILRVDFGPVETLTWGRSNGVFGNGGKVVAFG